MRELNTPRLEQALADAFGGNLTALAGAYARKKLRRPASAGEVNTHKRNIQRWLNGQKTSPRNIGLLAAAVELSPEDLLLPEPLSEDDRLDRLEAMMREALVTQERHRADLEALSVEVAKLVKDLRRALKILEAEFDTKQSRQAQQRQSR